MAQLKVLQDTTFTLQPVDSSTLPDSQKQSIAANSLFQVASYLPSENHHFKVALANQTFQGHNTWYVYRPHVQLLDDKGNSLQADTVQLKVPYLSQLDNVENPYGSCNVTSIAMALMYLGIKQQHPGKQFEDELQDWMAARGLDRHSPNDLVKLVIAYGAQDKFKTNATIDDVKNWLAQGNPAVTHGYFTSSGHVICLLGYNEKGFIVNDPYGEWFADGYDRNDYKNEQKGKALTYSYSMIQRTCMTDGQFWVHFLSK